MDIIERISRPRTHDAQATLDTYTDDIVWDDVTHPDSPFSVAQGGGRAGVLRDHRGDPGRARLPSGGSSLGEHGRYVVDESIVTGHVHGSWPVSRMRGAGRGQGC